MSEPHGRCAFGLRLQTLLLVVAGLFATTGHADQSLKADAVLVYKSERLLMLLRAGEIIGHFPISLGKNPVGPKTHEGDARTPEGRYYLDWRNPDSRFYRSIHISYPSPRDLAHAHRAGCATRRHGDDPRPAERSRTRRRSRGTTGPTAASRSRTRRWTPSGTPSTTAP